VGLGLGLGSAEVYRCGQLWSTIWFGAYGGETGDILDLGRLYGLHVLLITGQILHYVPTTISDV
jgi:hypothetical protein